MEFRIGDIVRYKPRNMVCTIVDINNSDIGGRYVLECNAPSIRNDQIWETITCSNEEDMEHVYSVKHRAG